MLTLVIWEYQRFPKQLCAISKLVFQLILYISMDAQLNPEMFQPKWSHIFCNDSCIRKRVATCELLLHAKTRIGVFSLSTVITVLLGWPQGIHYCRYKFQIKSDPAKSRTIGVVKLHVIICVTPFWEGKIRFVIMSGYISYTEWMY